MVVLAWLLNCTGNIVLVIVLHGGFNAAQQQFMDGFSGIESALVQMLTATVLIWRTRGTLAPAGRPSLGTVPLHEVPAEDEVTTHAAKTL